MNKKIIFIVILIVLLAPNFIFASDSTLLVGTWLNYQSELVMLNNGSGSWYSDIITWRIENNKLHITWKNGLYIYDYDLSGSRLSMIGISENDIGAGYVYTKMIEGIPDNSSFAGIWIGLESELVMLNDGSGSWYNDMITWRAEKNYLHITWRNELYTYNYSLSSSTLILVGISSNEKDKRYVYTKDFF